MYIRFTARGWSFLISGMALTIIAGVGSLPALLYGAGLLFALTLSSLIVIAAGRWRLSLARSVQPAALGPNESCTVTLRPTGLSRHPSGRWRDRIGPALVGTPAGMWPSDRRQVSYRISSSARGDHVIGPLTVVTIDPFGLVSRRITADDTARVTVLPDRTALSSVRLDGAAAAIQAQMAAPQVAAEADDVVVRSYAPGDGMKRISWKTTARVGELMVRQPEQHYQQAAAVLVDLRQEPRTIEWAVSAAASVVTHLADEGFDVALRSSDRTIDLLVGEGHQGITDALVTLARCQANDSPVLAGSDDAVVVLVAGALSPDRADAWLSLCRQATSVVAFVASATPDTTTELLRSAGWAVSCYGPGSDLNQLWNEFDSGRRRVA